MCRMTRSIDRLVLLSFTQVQDDNAGVVRTTMKGTVERNDCVQETVMVRPRDWHASIGASERH